ncbi:MAG: TetR/AcrR family transcriptional regulator [Phenylobacterium sp.]|jgi:AcrR family transcriptional regulator|nr:TetR/AcrR family transcriptional regulator [Phenylobacterium sp.]
MSDKKVRSLQRVVEIAAQAFSSRKFNDVSISEISEAARCSTSTIYSTFGSKENLFLDAMSHVLTTTAPGPTAVMGPSLHVLLGFAEARIRALANPARRGAVRAISSQIDFALPVVEALAGQQCGQVAQLLNAEITSCIEAGILRPLEPQLVAYSVMAVTAYEPLVYGLLYGDDKTVDVMKLLRRVFLPLVSEEGRRQLNAYLGEAARDGAPAANEDVVPLAFPKRRRAAR